MLPLKCLIVEDEPIAAEILEDYIGQVPFLEHVATCTDAIYAMEVLKQEDIGLLFLDIHLPKLKGLDFLRALSQPPPVILTTAYHQYALKGYELNVVDYLLKPIEFSRFLQAVDKVRKPQATVPAREAAERPYRFFNVNKRREKVYLDEILYVESLKEYVRIVTLEKEIITQFQIGELEQALNFASLIRIHRSFLVARDKVSAYSATEVQLGEKCLPIGRSYRVLFAREMKE